MTDNSARFSSTDIYQAVAHWQDYQWSQGSSACIANIHILDGHPQKLCVQTAGSSTGGRWACLLYFPPQHPWFGMCAEDGIEILE